MYDSWMWHMVPVFEVWTSGCVDVWMYDGWMWHMVPVFEVWTCGCVMGGWGTWCLCLRCGRVDV